MMKIGFAIIAEDFFVEKIVSLEHKFHDLAGFQNTLGVIENLPHTTLFQGEMKDDINYSEIADSLAIYTMKAGLKRLQFTGVEYVPYGWYFLMCEKSKSLFFLHNVVLNKVKPYIVLPQNRLNLLTEELPVVQREAIRAYNYRYAGNAFCPHITIGRTFMKNSDILNVLNEAIKRIDLSPRVDKITVYKMGVNGTHEKTLYEKKIPYI